MPDSAAVNTGIDESMHLLALPSATFERVSRDAVADVVGYFDPDLITIPGKRDAMAYATVRDVAPELPVVHPQLGGEDGPIHHYRYDPDGGIRDASDADVHDAPDVEPPAGTMDVLAVQNSDVLSRLQTQLSTGDRRTGGDAATFLIVPGLAVEWDTTELAATLPTAETFAAIEAALPEPFVVLAGAQPAEYYHEWSLSDDGPSVRVPVAGLGATDRDGPTVAQHTCTTRGGVAPEAVDADRFGLGALNGVGRATAERLRRNGCRTVGDVRDLARSDLAALPGIGRTTAETIQAHAEVVESGDPLVLTNKTPVKTRDGRPPLCLDVETDGLSPTIIWQFGVYDPETDSYQAFVEKRRPTEPERVLEAFITWLLANHGDRTLLTWNGYDFDYHHIEHFLRRYLPEYVDAWEDVWTYDLYKWAVRDGNALLPGRTNKLEHVARALGYDSTGTGLTGARTAAAYQEFMRNPDDPSREPDWDRHEAYCEDDCRALWSVYRAITDAPRRDVTDGGTGGADGTQAGLTDFER